MPKRIYYEDLLKHSNIIAFLLTIRKGEGTLGESGYKTLVGGSQFEDFRAHPRIYKKKYNSTAAGAFQFTKKTWVEDSTRLVLPDFTPRSQQLATAYEINRQSGAIEDILRGNIRKAIEKTNGIWVSLPGGPHDNVNKYSQGMPDALAFYQASGGMLSSDDETFLENAKRRMPRSHVSKARDTRRNTQNSRAIPTRPSHSSQKHNYSISELATAAMALGPPGIALAFGAMYGKRMWDKRARPEPVYPAIPLWSKTSHLKNTLIGGIDKMVNGKIHNPPETLIIPSLRTTEDTRAFLDNTFFSTYRVSTEMNGVDQTRLVESTILKSSKSRALSPVLDEWEMKERGIRWKRIKVKRPNSDVRKRSSRLQEANRRDNAVPAGSAGNLSVPAINIYLNRPLVENLVIYKTIGSEDHNLQNKIEEVLLRMLSSANAL